MHTRTQVPDPPPADRRTSSGELGLITLSCWPGLFQTFLAGLAKILKTSIIRGTDPTYHLAEGGKLARVRSSIFSLETVPGPRFLGQKGSCFLGSVRGPEGEPTLWTGESSGLSWVQSAVWGSQSPWQEKNLLLKAQEEPVGYRLRWHPSPPEAGSSS